MSGKKSIIKTMFIMIFIALFFLIMGFALLSKVEAETVSNVEIPEGFVKISAEIENITKETSEEYTRKGGKIKKTTYWASVRANYEGVDYTGVFGVSPFDKEGSEVDVILEVATGELKSSSDDVMGFVRFISYAPGAFITGIGVIIVLIAVISAIRKLSMFKEENKVYGVIVEVYENPNIIIDHKHPKKAICEITDPVTGGVRRVESANSKMDLFSMVGMNVPIYVNPKKPQKVFVDLENAEGKIKLAEGQQRVHDLRNL